MLPIGSVWMVNAAMVSDSYVLARRGSDDPCKRTRFPRKAGATISPTASVRDGSASHLVSKMQSVVECIHVINRHQCTGYEEYAANFGTNAARHPDVVGQLSLSLSLT
jgi:hypothetical protein